MPEEDSPWYVQLLVSTAVLVCVAILVGGIAAVAGLKAADYAGITAPQTAPETVIIPTPSTTSLSPSPATRSPTSSPSQSPTETRSPSQSPTETRSPSQSPTETRSPSQTPTETRSATPPQTRAITLSASPQQVPAYGQITLTGTYSAPDGTTLQVQRQETGGGWPDFPVTTTVNGGTFSTYIETGRTGTNRIRMTDSATGATSNVVTVDVG